MFSSISIPFIDPIAFYIFGWPVRWYGISYLLAFYSTWFLGRYFTHGYCSRMDLPKVDAKHFDQLLTACVLGVIIGGRLGHMIFYDFNGMSENPLSIVKTWEGGMAFHGGLIGFAIAAFFYIRRHQLNLPLLADMISLVAPIGIFYVRIANFINNELIGRVTNFPISVILYDENIPRHPSQFYEALLEGVLLFIILFFYYKKLLNLKNQGRLCGLFFIFYGIFRFLVEYVREPSDGIFEIFNLFFLTYGQLLTLPMVLIGGFIFSIRRNHV
jgi:phosphatidylglycerol:prolipoprotein diacylglycerol transferase